MNSTTSPRLVIFIGCKMFMHGTTFPPHTTANICYRQSCRQSCQRSHSNVGPIAQYVKQRTTCRLYIYVTSISLDSNRMSTPDVTNNTIKSTQIQCGGSVARRGIPRKTRVGISMDNMHLWLTEGEEEECLLLWTHLPHSKLLCCVVTLHFLPSSSLTPQPFVLEP